jgi:hypothetical protein
MSLNSEQRIGIIYEHTEQFNPIFDLLSKKGIPVSKVSPGDQLYDPVSQETFYALIFNDLSSPPYLSHQSHWISEASEYMRSLEISIGADRLINGSYTGDVMRTKSRQIQVFSSVNASYPKTRIVNNTDQLLAACNELKFPVVIKNNISNASGSAKRYETIREVINAIINNEIDLNGRKSLLIQEYIASKSNEIVRAEIINRQFRYATRVTHVNDYSSAWPLEAHAELYTPSIKTIRTIEKIAQAAKVDVGRIEYVSNTTSGDSYFLNIQPHTSSWSIPIDGFDFNPLATLVGYLEHRLMTLSGLRIAI